MFLDDYYQVGVCEYSDCWIINGELNMNNSIQIFMIYLDDANIRELE